MLQVCLDLCFSKLPDDIKLKNSALQPAEL